MCRQWFTTYSLCHHRTDKDPCTKFWNCYKVRKREPCKKKYLVQSVKPEFCLVCAPWFIRLQKAVDWDRTYTGVSRYYINRHIKAKEGVMQKVKVWYRNKFKEGSWEADIESKEHKDLQKITQNAEIILKFIKEQYSELERSRGDQWGEWIMSAIWGLYCYLLEENRSGLFSMCSTHQCDTFIRHSFRSPWDRIEPIYDYYYKREHKRYHATHGNNAGKYSQDEIECKKLVREFSKLQAEGYQRFGKVPINGRLVYIPFEQAEEDAVPPSSNKLVGEGMDLDEDEIQDEIVVAPLHKPKGKGIEDPKDEIQDEIVVVPLAKLMREDIEMHDDTTQDEIAVAPLAEPKGKGIEKPQAEEEKKVDRPVLPSLDHPMGEDIEIFGNGIAGQVELPSFRQVVEETTEPKKEMKGKVILAPYRG